MTCRFAFFLASAALSICSIGCSHSLRQGPASTSQPHKARFASTASGIPEELVFYSKELAAIKSRREAGDTSLAPVFGKIVKAADAALQFKPVSVMMPYLADARAWPYKQIEPSTQAMPAPCSFAPPRSTTTNDTRTSPGNWQKAT
jgi:hypothetical protein